MESLRKNATLILTILGILGAWFKGTQYVVSSEVEKAIVPLREAIIQLEK